VEASGEKLILKGIFFKKTGGVFLCHRGYFWVGLFYLEALGGQQREINFTKNFLDYRGYLWVGPTPFRKLVKKFGETSRGQLKIT
jgi:hypothetical protein